jgi:hypothetical protein
MADEGNFWRASGSDRGYETLVKIRRRLLRNGRLLDQRSVASLAVYVGVLAVLFFVHHFRVTGLATLMAGKLQWSSPNFSHGRCTIMPILPKGLGNNKVAYHQKHKESEDKESRKSKKMSYILENAHQAPFP